MDPDTAVETHVCEGRQEDDTVDEQIEDDRAADATIRHVMETIGGRTLDPIAISGCSWHAP